MSNRPQLRREPRPFASGLPSEEEVRQVGHELVRVLEERRPDWAPALGRTIQAEVERALLQGLTAAFRTLAEQLPQLLATTCQEPSPPAEEETGCYRLFPEPETQPIQESSPQFFALHAPAAEAPRSPASETRADFPQLDTTELTAPAETTADHQRARAHCRRARKLTQNGDVAHALAHYAEAIRCDPHYLKAHVARGQLLHAAGELESAATDFRAAIAIDPASIVAHLCLGNTLLAQMHWQQAIAASTEAIRLDPSREVAYFLRAAAYIRQGRNREAIADLTRVLQIEPDNPLAHNARGEAYANTGEHDRAIADFGRALALQPNLLAAHYHRAVALRHKGEYALAVVEFSQLIERRPDFPRVYYQRALAHLGLDHYDRAIADLDRALELDPNDQEARQRRERALQARVNQPATPPPPDVPEQTAPAPREKADSSCLSLKCPSCSAPARISWQRLDKLFKCRQCARVFRVSREGILTEVDLSQGVPRRWSARRVWGAAAGVLLAVALAGWWYWSSDRVPALAELPHDLKARGELLAKGWLGNDRFLLRRLTDPAYDRQLHPWLQRHRPQLPKGRTGGAQATSAAKIQVHIRQQRPSQATLVVHVNAPSLGRPVELLLRWRKRADTWYFVPSARG